MIGDAPHIQSNLSASPSVSRGFTAMSPLPKTNLHIVDYLQKAYLSVADFAKPKLSYAKVYKDLKTSEVESTFAFYAQALPTTPAAARIADTVKRKITKHSVSSLPLPVTVV
jgi:hypothetical protein